MNTEQISDPEASERHVCPWQHVFILDNFLRPLLHNTQKLFGPYVHPGMTALDVGCGRGFASLGLARLVGEKGRVISADLQPQMLEMVKERAEQADLSDRIRIHQCEADRIGVQEELDFALAFWMLHEVPDSRAFLEEIFSLLKIKGQFLVIEPTFHTRHSGFERSLDEAKEVGFTILERPRVRFSRAALLTKDI